MCLRVSACLPSRFLFNHILYQTPNQVRFGICDLRLRIGRKKIPNPQSQIPNQDVSVARQAERRSSKPKDAGSIPVAHSTILSFVISPLSFVS